MGFSLLRLGSSWKLLAGGDVRDDILALNRSGIAWQSCDSRPVGDRAVSWRETRAVAGAVEIVFA